MVSVRGGVGDFAELASVGRDAGSSRRSGVRPVGAVAPESAVWQW
jgi:hypothetical protein